MARPGRTVLVALVVFGGTALLVPRLGTEFLPELDEGSILIQPTRDPNISLTHSMEVARRVEEVVGLHRLHRPLRCGGAERTDADEAVPPEPARVLQPT